jgi:hypothetical protein
LTRTNVKLAVSEAHAFIFWSLRRFNVAHPELDKVWCSWLASEAIFTSLSLQPKTIKDAFALTGILPVSLEKLLAQLPAPIPTPVTDLAVPATPAANSATVPQPPTIPVTVGRVFEFPPDSTQDRKDEVVRTFLHEVTPEQSRMVTTAVANTIADTVRKEMIEPQRSYWMKADHARAKKDADTSHRRQVAGGVFLTEDEYMAKFEADEQRRRAEIEAKAALFPEQPEQAQLARSRQEAARVVVVSVPKQDEPSKKRPEPVPTKPEEDVTAANRSSKQTSRKSVASASQDDAMADLKSKYKKRKQ